MITDAAGRRDCVHIRLTSPDVFIRFVGNGLHPSDYTRINEWIGRMETWVDRGLRREFSFMHQHEELHSPELAHYFIQQLNKRCGTNIPEPQFVANIDAATIGETKPSKARAKKPAREKTKSAPKAEKGRPAKKKRSGS